MKKTKIFTGKLLRVAFWLIVLYTLSLSFHQQELPASWLARICEGLSTSQTVVHCEGLSFGLRHGVQFRGVRVIDSTRHNPLVPLFSAESISIWPFERRVRIVDLRFPRLGDPYYDGTADYSSSRVEVPRLPNLPSFALELERGEILGVAPQQVRAQVQVSGAKIAVSQISLDWPDQDHPMHLDGWCEIDFDRQRVTGEVRGDATQAQIRPLLVALDVPVAYPYFDGFTKVEGPVRARCAWNVDLVEPGFKLDLDLHPVMGQYNGVSMRQADGQLSLDIHLPGGQFEYLVQVGPIQAMDRQNGELTGIVQLQKTNGVFHVGFDAATTMPFQDVLDIIGYFNDGLLDCIVCETPPRFFVKGQYYPYLPHTLQTDLHGRFSVMKGSILGIPLLDASTDWAMIGETLSFSNAVAHGSHGGMIFGTAEIQIPDLDGDRARMKVDLSYENGTVAELAEAFKFDASGRHGQASGAIQLDFPIGTNAVSQLNGHGRIRIKDGQVMQTRLFAGLTAILAEKVPGIGLLVNQSDLSAEFDIRDGVASVKQLLIEGSVFSVVAEGTYNLVTDSLDFRCRLTLMRRHNPVGVVLSPIIWPVSKMLMEVKVSGSVKDPRWNYIGLIDRIQE